MVLKALLFNTAKFMTKCLLLVKCGTSTAPSPWRVLVRNGSVASLPALPLTTTISSPLSSLKVLTPPEASPPDGLEKAI